MKTFSILLVTLFILGCSNQSITTITLYTDQSEVLSLVDAFNRSSNSIKIDINSGVSTEDVDIIIFKGLPSESPIELKDLSNYREFIDTELLYNDLYSIDTDLIPLSFDLSGVIYNKKNRVHSYNIDITNFMEMEHKFSPFWNADFLTWYYLNNLPDFIKDNSYLDIDTFITTSKNILNLNDNWDVEEFNNKYLHLSPERLIEMNVIDYYFYTLSDYIKLSDKQRETIGFTLFSSNGLLQINDSMNYIGISQNSKRVKHALTVLQWLINEDNQNYYIDINKRESGLAPLFLGELSTLKSVTTLGIPQIYPELKHMLPLTSEITTPLGLPVQWTSLKSEVFGKLLKEIIDINEEQWEVKYNEYYTDWAKTHNK